MKKLMTKKSFIVLCYVGLFILFIILWKDVGLRDPREEIESMYYEEGLKLWDGDHIEKLIKNNDYEETYILICIP